jgi:hypothetical protein
MALENNDASQETVVIAPFYQHSKRKQLAVIFLFFVGYFFLLFLLETWLSQQWQATNEFAYKEFYSKPFHYKLVINYFYASFLFRGFLTTILFCQFIGPIFLRRNKKWFF